LTDLGISSAVGGVAFGILEFGIARLLPAVMGPIGWAVSAILAIFTLSKATDKNDEILQKVIESSKPIIKNELNSKTEIIKDFIKMSSTKLTSQLGIINERIDSIKESLEGKDKHQQALKDIENKISEIQSFLDELK
jgi:hypothetical protein